MTTTQSTERKFSRYQTTRFNRSERLRKAALDLIGRVRHRQSSFLQFLNWRAAILQSEDWEKSPADVRARVLGYLEGTLDMIGHTEHVFGYVLARGFVPSRELTSEEMRQPISNRAAVAWRVGQGREPGKGWPTFSATQYWTGPADVVGTGRD